MNKFLGAVLIIAIFIVALGVWQNYTKSPTAKINNYAFKLYVARAPKDKEIGLSKYKNLSMFIIIDMEN